jgi:putative ABC transport system permease protein
MVVGQLALSLMLLTAGGLFLRGALAAAAADPGFPMAGGLVVSLDPSAGGFDEARGRAAYRAVLTRVRSLPGVEAASLASLVAFGDFSEGRDVETPGRRGATPFAYLTTVGADYFASLGLPVLRGRGFTASEESDPNAPRVAIVDELVARTLWPGQAPIGQQVRFATAEGDVPEAPFEVVGVVPSTRHELFVQQPQGHLYLPSGSHYRAPMNLHVRLTTTAAEAEQAMLGTLRRELRAIDPTLPIMSAKTLNEHRDASISMWVVRAGAGLFSTFGVLAVLLAAVGLYGVKSYLVSRRTREIGIRMALGARSSDVVRMILGEGLQVTAAGLGLGLILSGAAAMAVGKMLYRVNPLDPTTFVAASLVLLMAAVAACWLPARKATRIVTVKALRSE